MLLSFVIILCLEISHSTPVSNGPCRADNRMWFVFDYQPCSKLLDPTDRLGIYKTRRERCEDPLTDCCVSCEKIRQEYSCEESLNGITLADGTYPCSKLADPNDRLGIYKNRLPLCHQPETRCCVTCKDIGAECEQPNTGVYIADGSYPCSALLDPTDKLGIYKRRGELCEDKITSCCITCKRVRQQLSANGTSSGKTQKPRPSTTLKTITGGNPVNQACERNVWIAGGAYECRYLLDTSNKYGIYLKRRDFCRNGIADCCVTCDKVLKETTTAPPTVTTDHDVAYTVISTETHGRKSTKNDCESSVWIADGSYECSLLLDPANKYDIYRNRHKFCKNGAAQCCRTCAKVNLEKTSAVPPSKIMAKTSTGPSSVCKDEWIFIYNRYLQCGRLTDTRNSLDIYRRRKELCQLPDTRCCKTCAQIIQGTTVKPSGVKNFNENIVNKPHETQSLKAANTNIAAEPQTIDNAASDLVKMDAINKAIQQGFMQFFRMFAQFQARAQQQLNNNVFNRP